MSVEVLGWVTAGASLLGVWLNIHRDQRCFAVWAVTNVTWVGVDCYYGVWPQAALQAIYAALAVYGYRKWRRDAETKKAQQAQPAGPSVPGS